MHINSIVAAATIALIAGVGSVSADENDVAGTAVNTGAPFALLDGLKVVIFGHQRGNCEISDPDY